MDVFIVEDEPMIQELYVDALTIRGHRVIGAAVTGEEAVRMISKMEKVPPLVIMDHRMPGMGGLSAAREILEMDPSARIVLVSADDGAVWESLKLGIVGLKKPFNIGDLMRSIEVAMPATSGSTRSPAKRGKTPSARDGGLYLVEEPHASKAISLFKDLLEEGYHGIAFTRKHPDELKKELGVPDVPVAWFTSTPDKEQTCITPVNIQKMIIMVQSAISRDNRAAVLVTGFEYILSNLQFERALNLIQVLNDRVMSSNMPIVIFSMDLGILTERERKLISLELLTL
ncbi:MAG: DUF835 domain-containing protein [Thermoplasmatota archaeon]